MNLKVNERRETTVKGGSSASHKRHYARNGVLLRDPPILNKEPHFASPLSAPAA